MNEFKYDRMMKVLRDISTYLFLTVILLMILSTGFIVLLIGMFSK